MRRNGPIIISLLSLIFICALADFALANDYLWLITTITPGRDSTQITSVTPVGDYNADGHGDLLVGLRGTAGAHPWFEAADLYFGGPAFDSLPDMRFFGDPQNLDLCDLPGYQETCFGSVATPLGDFNGDSYDDFAVSAIAYCNHTVVGGRVYIYLGGPAADTMPDLVIDTYQDYDAFGYFLDDGDFNGDGLGDLLTGTRDVFYGQRVYIYLGGAPPDTIHDWLCDYSGQHAHLANQSGGFDTDGDGFDDFAWQDQATTPVSWHFFRGGAPPSPQPYFTTQEFSLGFREFDVSGDGVDDFFSRGRWWVLPMPRRCAPGLRARLPRGGVYSDRSLRPGRGGHRAPGRGSAERAAEAPAPRGAARHRPPGEPAVRFHPVADDPACCGRPRR